MRVAEVGGEIMRPKLTKPCGPFADVKELEYIAALHQTGKKVRKDGSIHAVDIQMFLMSRYGIKAPNDEIRTKIIGSFGEHAMKDAEEDFFAEGDVEGGQFENTARSQIGSGSLDLTEVLAMLLIPELLKAEQSLVRTQPQEKQTLPEPDTAVTIQSHGEKGKKHWPDADLIANVLCMILHDATGDSNPRPLTKELLHQILTFYGERSLADDEGLLDDMLMATNHKLNPSEAPILFDCHAFARALTHDVHRFNIDNENSMTSNYYDVLQSFDATERMCNNKALTCLPQRNPFTTENVVSESGMKRVATFASIDYTADTFRERGFAVVIWTTWVSTYLAYLLNDHSNLSSITKLDCNNMSETGCQICQAIVNWLVIMAELSILGTAFIVSASLGNSVYPTNFLWIVIGMGAVSLFVLVPYFKDIESDIISTEKEPEMHWQVAYTLSMLCGFTLLATSVLNVVQRTISNWYDTDGDGVLDNSEFRGRFSWMLIPQMVRLEAQLKQAASYKMNLMLRNACEVHEVAEFDGRTSFGEGDTAYGKAMLAFARHSDRTEEITGGILNTWRKIFDGSLFTEEGIWFTTHMLAANFAQCTLFVLVGAFFYSCYTNELFQFLLSLLDDYTTNESLQWRLILPLFVGITSSEITVFRITSNYIPSAVCTTLQFRSGGIGTLRCNTFQSLRFAVDDTTLIFGTMFWGTLYSSIAIGLLLMAVLGLLLWPGFEAIGLTIFSTLVGITITMLVKYVVLIGFRNYNHSGFYRKYVATANVVGVILETWNLGLTTAIVTFRAVKILIAATLCIAKVDTPFLSESAGFLAGIELDPYPTIFRKDILAHEAHRHPYLERLGVMYLLKLGHDDFGNYAGTCWRMLFVYALVPWMRKHRISDGNTDMLSSSKVDSSHTSSKRQRGQSGDNHATVLSEREALKARVSDLEQLLAAARSDLELANIDRNRALVSMRLTKGLEKALHGLESVQDAKVPLLTEQPQATKNDISFEALPAASLLYENRSKRASGEGKSPKPSERINFNARDSLAKPAPPTPPKIAGLSVTKDQKTKLAVKKAKLMAEAEKLGVSYETLKAQKKERKREKKKI